MKIIAFAGMPFSGKSEAVAIAKELDIPVIRMGDMVWEETRKQGYEINDANVGMVANNMRNIYGMEIWASRTINKIKEMENRECLIIDGIRNIEEIEFFQKKLGADFTVVGIEVSDETRHKRALSRGRADDSGDLEKIKERDKRELLWGLAKVIETADINISNEGTVEELRNKIKEVLEINLLFKENDNLI